MNKIKKNINTVAFISALTLCIPNFIIKTSVFRYRPKSYILFLSIYFILTGLMTFFSIKYRNKASKLSSKLGSFLIFSSLIYVITLPLDYEIDNRLSNIFYFVILVTITASSSLLIFFMYNKIEWLKIGMAIFGVLLLPYYVLLFFTSFFLSNFGANTITQTLPSPDKAYSAYILSSDQGALGGATEVYVRNMDKDIHLLSGTLKTESKKIWYGGWGMEPVLSWQNNDTLIINGVSYDIE